MDRSALNIVDAQVHMGRGEIETTLSAMQALGIRSALLYEFWGAISADDPGDTEPSYRLPNGAWRIANPTVQEAAIRFPDRFSYVVKVDRRDPDLESLLRMVKSTPSCRAVRILPVRTAEEAEAFSQGAYDPLFDLAERLDLPVFVFVPGQVERLLPYLHRFPKVRIAVDHCGMPFPGLGGPGPAVSAKEYFDTVLQLAAFSNVQLKWSHGPDLFEARDFPYVALRPHLRRAIEAFGADRLMWASDHTVMRAHSWGDLLQSVRDDDGLSGEERHWILGKTLRKFVDWPETPAA